jgi:hypothetical protein
MHYIFAIQLTYKIEILDVYVRLYLEKVKTNLPQTLHAYALKRGRDFRKVKRPE